MVQNDLKSSNVEDARTSPGQLAGRQRVLRLWLDLQFMFLARKNAPYFRYLFQILYHVLFEGYSLCSVRLLNTSATISKMSTPDNTGLRT